ncbi:MAG: PGPGW domain-containing protein [Verrucomicrobiota bacterium]
MLDWLSDNQALLTWLGGASVFMLIGSLVITGVVIVRMNEDYFLPERDADQSFAELHPVLRWTGLILKNIAGLILLIAGTVMVFIPGQGLIVMFIGLMLMNFPGKRKLELGLIRRAPVSRAINWLRAKANRPPLNLPPVPDSGGAGT